MANMRAFLHPGLGLRQMARRIALSAAELSGITIISTRARDKIVDAAPWVAPYFFLSEKTRRSNDEMKTSTPSDNYLRRDNPRLTDLARRYSAHPAAGGVRWANSNVEAQIDLSAFRGDNLYVFQSRRYPPSSFYATAAYVKEVDRLDLWNKLHEDGRFGAQTFDFHGKTMSRDLLDSILEINFLNKHLNFCDGRAIKVLDIGAGYGRLAHRMATAVPNIGKYYCTDAVPESTFVSEYYLKLRGMTDRCSVLPLDTIESLEPVVIDLAVNIHSFPECTAKTIGWWLLRVREMRVPWLFIEVTPQLGLTSHEPRGARKDFRPLIEASGFKLAIKEHKFQDAPVLQEYGLYPSDYYLFHRV